MPFLRCLIQLSRLFLGFSLDQTSDRVHAVHLGLFDRFPFPKWFASWYFFRRLKRFLPPAHIKSHTFVVGRSGSGKSELLKLLALDETTEGSWFGRRTTRRDQSVILIDPHGDLALQFAQQRPFYTDFNRHPDDPNLIYLDPVLALKKRQSPILNPFELYGHQHLFATIGN